MARGNEVFPRGKMVLADGNEVFPPGKMVLADGKMVFPVGNAAFPAGRNVLADPAGILPTSPVAATYENTTLKRGATQRTTFGRPTQGGQPPLRVAQLARMIRDASREELSKRSPVQNMSLNVLNVLVDTMTEVPPRICISRGMLKGT